MGRPIAFEGEVQFRRYSDTSTQGQQIVFAVADRESLEPFIGSEGKRYMAVLVEIGADEMPVQQEPRKDKRGPLCREACDLCELPAFQHWLPWSLQSNEGSIFNAERCKQEILYRCGISSRKELDEKPVAAQIFIDRFRIPFMSYTRQRERIAA